MTAPDAPIFELGRPAMDESSEENPGADTTGVCWSAEDNSELNWPRMEDTFDPTDGSGPVVCWTRNMARDAKE